MFNSINKTINNVIKNTKVLHSELNRGVKTDSIKALNKELSGVIKSINTVVDSLKKMQSVSGTAVNAANQTTAAAAKSKPESFGTKLKNYGVKAKGVATDLWPKVKSGMDMTDKYARQNYQLESIAGKNETPDQLRQKVYSAAQSSRSGYDGTLSTVTKLAKSSKDDFKSNDEIISFTELMNKAFSGLGADEAAKSIEKVTNAMVNGKIKGEELGGIMEKSPMLAQALTKYTGQSQEKLAAGPGVSDDVLRNAMFNSADDISAKFQQMPVTFESVWNTINNKVGSILGPIMQKITEFLGSTNGQMLVNGIINGIGILGSLLNNLYNLAIKIASFFASNWSIIAPIIWGIVAALIVYNAKMAISWLSTMKDLAAKGMHAIASGIETIQIIAMTIAQDGLNAALAMCPITWIIIGIIILVALFYAAVAAINHFAGTSISATGVIAGAFAMLGANIYNLFAYMWNQVAAFVEFFANVFTNPVYSVKRLFVNVFSNILDFIKSIASAIDMVFGSNIAGGIENLQNEMNGWLGDMPDNYTVIPRLEMKDPAKAWNSGYEYGENLEKSFDLSSIMGPEMLNDYSNNLKPAISPNNPANTNDSNNLATTAANTGAMKNSMDIAEENLVYMRDVAERD
ncbi:MAG: tape measure protein [Eubacterium sp.]|nr:tape measure protein [Eubacterium sp.]